MTDIITIELAAPDAHRLLWLVQNTAAGPIWNDYWATLADHILSNILDDEEVLTYGHNQISGQGGQ